MVKLKFCFGCQRPLSDCVCRHSPVHSSVHTSDGNVYLQRQTKGRNGKSVVIISGLPLAREPLTKLAKSLKSKCGVGGTVEGSNILIQGDKRDILRKELEKLGYTVKLSGG